MGMPHRYLPARPPTLAPQLQSVPYLCTVTPKARWFQTAPGPGAVSYKNEAQMPLSGSQQREADREGRALDATSKAVLLPSCPPGLWVPGERSPCVPCRPCSQLLPDSQAGAAWPRGRRACPGHAVALLTPCVPGGG